MCSSQIHLVLIFAVSILCGCGQGRQRTFEERLVANGVVKIDGKLLDKGRIVFESPDDAINGIPPGTGLIRHGNYQASVSLGSKTVRIYAPPETGEEDETGLTLTEETVPAIYNATSELQATITADGPRTFDFDLTTPPAGKPSRRK